jgi:exopolyphosphatase
MSRLSVRTFLVQAKNHLQLSAKREGKTKLVVGNVSADLDSIICAIVYGYIQSSTVQARRANDFTIPITNIPEADLALRPELTALLSHAGVQPSDLITLDDISSASLPAEKTTWTLVDHNTLTGTLAETYRASQDAVIDHHDDEGQIPSSATPRIITKSGSCSSLVTNYCRETWDAISSASSSVGTALGQSSDSVVDDAARTSTWDAQVAKLALGAILIDTHNMQSADKVTPHDTQAVRYLEARIYASHKMGKSYDRDGFFQELDEAKSDLEALSLEGILRKDYKQWSEKGMVLGMSTVVKPIAYLQKKEADILPTLVAFAKKRGLQLFAVMTAFTDEKGEFARELLVLALQDGKVVEVAEGFASSAASKLELEESVATKLDSHAEVKWMQMWEQRNLAASRKQVGPMVREAMREGGD